MLAGCAKEGPLMGNLIHGFNGFIRIVGIYVSLFLHSIYDHFSINPKILLWHEMA